MDLIQTLQNIFSARRLSQAKVAKLFGFGSQTSIARLMAGKTSTNLLWDFAGRVLSGGVIHLTEDEETSLRLALNDQSGHLACERLWRLMTGERDETPREVTILDTDSGARFSLLEYMRSAREASVEIFNCQSPYLLNTFRALASQIELRVSACYYRCGTVAEALSMLESVFGVLGYPWFRASVISPTRDEQGGGMLTARFMMIHRIMSDGVRQSTMLVPQNDHEMWMTRLFDNSANAWHNRVLSGAEEKPLENTASRTENYAEYLYYCLNLEKNHSIVQIKSDFDVAQIPVDIQADLFRRGPYANHPEFTRLFPYIEHIESERARNIQSMRSSQQRFYRTEGFEEFVRTGVLSDQFCGFDSFSLAERKTVLQHILKTMDENQAYELLFFKPGTSLSFNEITWYEKRGISLLLPETHYDMKKNGTEACFFCEPFERFFSQTFARWLRREKTLSADESRAFLTGLLDSIKE